jgi:hypothetical protein
MKNVMLTATEARAKAQNDVTIFTEIRELEDAILSAISNGSYSAETTDTTMTLSVTYCNVWKGVTEDRAKFIQMSQVVSYFTDLGYAIERRVNSSTGNTFKWIVSW